MPKRISSRSRWLIYGMDRRHAGNVDALLVLHHAVVLHPAADLPFGGLQHRQPHQSVVQQDGVPGLHVLGQLGVGDGAPALVAGNVVGGQGKAPGRFSAAPARSESSSAAPPAPWCPAWRPPADAAPPAGPPAASRRRLMLVMAAVGEIEPGHVHARLEHLPQHPLPVGGRTQGAYDFCLSHGLSSLLCWGGNPENAPPWAPVGSQGGRKWGPYLSECLAVAAQNVHDLVGHQLLDGLAGRASGTAGDRSPPGC